MKFNNIKLIAIAVLISLTAYNCSDDDAPTGPTAPNFTGTYIQQDQMGRPAVNTVFVSSGYQAMFQTNLEALSPAYNTPTDANALGLTSAQFSGFLATDVLNVSLDGTTTFYDGTNVLTGRTLADDVITVELLLIFGGEDFSENPAFSDDHVDANDKPFLTSFPYLASPW